MRTDQQLAPEQKSLFTDVCKETAEIVVLNESYEAPESIENYTYSDYEYDAHELENITLNSWSLKDAPQVKVRLDELPPGYKRIHLESLANKLLSMPDVRVFRSVTLVDFKHRDQLWFKMQNNDGYLQKELLPGGDILFYQLEEDDAFPAICDLFSRLLKLDSPKQSELFDRLTESNGPLFFKNIGEREDSSAENIWSELCSILLWQKDPNWRLIAAKLDAVASTLIVSSLQSHLKTLPDSLKSSNHKIYDELMKFVSEQVAPEALKIMSETETMDESFRREYSEFVTKEFSLN